MDDDIPYLLLTPGPLTTSKSVKQTMLQDFCTWDDDYNGIVTRLRGELARLASSTNDFTTVLMQGSGTFSVESTLGSVIPPDGKLLVLENGAYGERMGRIAERLNISCQRIACSEVEPVDPERCAQALEKDATITHVGMVHCETTTGILNPVAEVGRVVERRGKRFVVDAMSSFGGMPLSMESLRADFLITSANKCLQGVPGFGIVIAKRTALVESQGWARSLSLDLFDQWQEMERHAGKWRYTSPTHTVRALVQALVELDREGGIAARHRRYAENHRVLVEGFESLGLRPLLPARHRSVFITSFLYPDHPNFTFRGFYDALKKRRFVIYPGKISQAETFRVGTIGHVFPPDMAELVRSTGEALAELGIELAPCSETIRAAR